MKKYIWAFSGTGKSHINNEKIVDADCEQFKYIFPDGVSDNLHKVSGWQGVSINPEYPENYFKYIESLDADIVLLNCHISLLERFDKEQVLLVYPCVALVPEYLERYKARGDNESFISYMTAEAVEMIRVINESSYKKYEVQSANTYLSDLFERNDFKVKVLNRYELQEEIQRAMNLGVLNLDEDSNVITFNVEFANISHSNDPIYKLGAETVVSVVLDGRYELDIDQLRKVCAEREAQIEKEKVLLERRGSLTREELEDKIMQGIVNGALGIRYAEIAPYSHGYEVTFGGDGPIGSTRTFKNRWSCYDCGLFDVPGKVAKMIEQDKQFDRVFGDKAQVFNVHEMIKAIDVMEEKKITSFILEKDTDFERWNYPYNIGSVASVMDVHAGKGLDGIVQHHYHGSYSTITPVRQNQLVEALVCLKGFCLDCISSLDVGSGEQKKIIEYLKKHGTDISTPEKHNEWIMKNPEKCGKEELRTRALFNEGHKLYAQAYCDFIKLKSIVDKHTGSLEELCEKLGGRDFDGKFFDVSFGALDATILCENEKNILNDRFIGIWDATNGVWVEENISLEYLEDTCEEIGFNLKELEVQALSKNKLSLDEQLKSAATRASDLEEKNFSSEIDR